MGEKQLKPILAPVHQGARNGFRPPTRLRSWEWMARNVKVMNSERSGKYDPEQTPWWKAPLEAAADFETREIVCLAPTGSGKSAMFEALISFVVCEDPGPLLYASQTDADAKFWGETRLIPALKQCQPMKGLWPEDRHQSRKLEIIFPHMPVVLGGANMSNFQEKSARWLIGDEVWKWGKGLIREFMARHHNRWNRKVLLSSQGGETGENNENEFYLEWLKTPMADFSWRCECGCQQAFSFDSVRFDRIDRDGTIDEEATANTARMECVQCRKQYADTPQNRRMLSDSNMGNGSMGYLAKNPRALDGYAGFHVDGLAIWWIPWAEHVREFLEADRVRKAGVFEKLKQWRQKRLAEFWSESMADVKIEMPRGTFTKADHEDGKPIDGEIDRYMTVDMGGDHFWAIVTAWKRGGGCRMLWEGYVQGTGGEETGLRDLGDRFGVARQKVFLDVGFEWDRAVGLCAKHGWTGVRGEGNKRGFEHAAPGGRRIQKLFSPIKRATTSGGTIRYIFLATNPIKDIAHRILTGKGAPLELPADLSKAFQNHCLAERRETVTAAKTGQEESIWVTRHRANHLWDCWVYSVGAALIFGVFGDSD